jgi:hypothetical protein
MTGFSLECMPHATMVALGRLARVSEVASLFVFRLSMTV